MKRLWYFPLEFIEARDYRMFDSEMCKSFAKRSSELEVYRISPDTDQHSIVGGWVMGGASHAKFCSDQASMFLKKLGDGEVRSGDALFFNDFWHFGVEAIKYAAMLAKIDLKFFGYIHAGTFTEFDFAEPMKDWGRHFERSLFEIADRIFVATEKPKKDILKCGLVSEKKVRVVGHPFDVEALKKYEVIPKINRVIFPHRTDEDKRPKEFIKLARELRGQHEFIMTLGGKSKSDYPEIVKQAEDAGITVFENLKKSEYYEILASSKVMVSTAVQENWGVCTFESLHLGVVPVCPNRCSYPYILPTNVLYNDEAKLKGMVSAFAKSKVELSRYRDDGKSADRMVNEVIG